MVFYLVLAVHLLVSLILIAVVLLQSGKGADLAGAFGGGGSQTAFGSRGAATFLSKLTTACAVIFMMTSLGLAILYNKQNAGSVMEGVPSPATPAPGGVPQAQPPAPQQAAPAPSQQATPPPSQPTAPSPSQQQPPPKQ
ncbi:MAG: preprotein translocase subunit SecG [Acidobacteria bacterium]|nr:preprotein translocase subunit SecG [Acidobacteriota bacterium]